MSKESALDFLERLYSFLGEGSDKKLFHLFMDELGELKSQLSFEIEESMICQCDRNFVVAQYCLMNSWIGYSDNMIWITRLGEKKIRPNKKQIGQKKENHENDNLAPSMGPEIFHSGKYDSREDQSKFRSELITKYEKCMISGNAIENVLEAAHINPHAKGGLAKIENGLLLRSDLHKLYDDELIIIDIDEDGEGIVQINSKIKSSDGYEFDTLKINPVGNAFPAIRERAKETRRSDRWKGKI